MILIWCTIKKSIENAVVSRTCLRTYVSETCRGTGWSQDIFIIRQITFQRDIMNNQIAMN